jgi:hypothetical protein
MQTNAGHAWTEPEDVMALHERIADQELKKSTARLAFGLPVYPRRT